MTEYNGQTIAYDEMGNPLTYRGYTFGWRGKQLTSASDGTNTLTFEYNEDGLRQKKTVNNVVTDYFYNGSVLIGMQRGQSKFLFSYDAGGNVISVRYITANDTNEYYYLRNAQGDIVKLIDASGNTVVEYTYDTWGKKVTTTGSLAGTLGLFQPFRYRGYVYDWETGFYYLQSRYYDPTTGRFISADVLLSTGQGVLGHNCYAYCLGNPANCFDSNGVDAIWIQEEGEAGTFGHSGLMVQNENGDWYYFYWGPQTEKISLAMVTTGVPNGIYFDIVNVGGKDLSKLSELKDALKGNGNTGLPADRADNITGICYFTGDYTATYNYLDDLKDTKQKYHLLFNNCVQKTRLAFLQSDIRFALTYYADIQDCIPNCTYIKVKVLSITNDKNDCPWGLII